MDGSTEIEIRLHHDIAAIPGIDWDRCAAPECSDGGRPFHPFTTHAFLSALEDSGSAHARTGWAPHHLTAHEGGRLVGAMPLYLKNHSQGEYVFDHSWAHAFERAGGDYYPKFQCSVPFTPATGDRLLASPDSQAGAEAVRQALLSGAVQITEQNGISSLHITFCSDADWARAGEFGLLRRTDQQFHWLNRGYAGFDDFLDALASRKRKTLRKERQRATENGIEIVQLTGDAIEPEHWDAFWVFYQDTGARKWGTPYLNRRFFELAHRDLREHILLVMSRRGGEWVAGALNLIGRETLYGRYWGCTEDHPCLHFETCYYQAIDFAIAHGLKRVEAGAQGGHKLARGYEPVATKSVHWITDPGFRGAVKRYLDGERAAVEHENLQLARHTPFKQTP